MTDAERQHINELITEIADGNVRAMDELSRLVSARMLSVARSVVRSRAAAEDVVQDSFVKILTKSKHFKRGTNGYAWICKIVQNTALNAIRRERGHPSCDIDGLFDLADGTDVSERSTAALAVAAAMRVLSEDERTVIFQKYFMDFTVRDSAKALGISKSAVARRIAAAETKMREYLNSRDKNDG